MKKILVIFLLITIFTRFFNLNSTARFIWDESMDLVNLKTLYIHPKITLIGPISEDRVKVFSSLTYYLFLPFAAFLKFDPVSTAYSTAFFGVITVILFWLLLFKQKKLDFLNILLPIIAYPLLVSSRWAWNPHFIPFWQSLAFLILFSKLPYKNFIVGILFGLTIHQHWYALFACLAIPFIVYQFSPKKSSLLSYFFGLFTSIFPFILFDITHPPGLFITRMLFFSTLSPRSGAFNFSNIILNLIKLPQDFFIYLTGTNNLLLIIIFILPLLIGLIKRQAKFNYLLLPLLFQIIGLSFIGGQIFDHYFLAAIIPFILWISLNISNKYFKISGLLLIFIFIFNIPKIFFQTDWSNNINATRQIVTYIKKDQQIYPTKFNLVTLGSPDPNTKARRFRDLLSIQNIVPESPDNYQSIDTLYLISYQNDWSKLSQDSAYELDYFRQLTPKVVKKIDNSPWFIYKISRNNN